MSIAILKFHISSVKTNYLRLLNFAITPTNRNSAQIADINNKNQVSALLYFADTVNIPQGKQLLNQLQKLHK